MDEMQLLLGEYSHPSITAYLILD